MTNTPATLALLAAAVAAAGAHASSPPGELVPTIGRIVHYYPGGIKDIQDGKQPRPAMICFVHTSIAGGVSCINVGYLDESGSWLSQTSVMLHAPESTVPETGGFAVWMPFQAGQAKAQAAPTVDPVATTGGPPDATLVKTHDNGVPVDNGGPSGTSDDGVVDAEVGSGQQTAPA